MDGVVFVFVIFIGLVSAFAVAVTFVLVFVCVFVILESGVLDPIVILSLDSGVADAL